jgi:hypothetical protein
LPLTKNLMLVMRFYSLKVLESEGLR